MAVAESSWLDQGTRFLGGIAEVYGTYEKSRAADLEFARYDAAPAPQPAAAIPGWLLIGGAVLGVVVLLRVIR